MQDTSVVCWGENNDGQAGGTPVTASPYNIGPTPVLVSSGGSPFTGAIDVAAYGSAGQMCAVTSSLDMQCWGGSSKSPYPASFTDSTSTAVAGLRDALAGGTPYLGYIDAAGRVTVNGTVLTSQPPCTNLLQ
jgi:hypothetical protein